MQISISGHHVDVTSALRDYVGSKLDRLQRHYDHIGSVDVILTVEKLVQKAEANLQVAGAVLHAASQHDDMYAAIDLLADKLDRQLLKHKEKQQDRLQGNGAR